MNVKSRDNKAKGLKWMSPKELDEMLERMRQRGELDQKWYQQ